MSKHLFTYKNHSINLIKTKHFVSYWYYHLDDERIMAHNFNTLEKCLTSIDNREICPIVTIEPIEE